ncbi:MAG: phosphonate metabolism protein/1,5-bisphosphokinase (PRPP-forming) PhnN [Rhodobiaceae bacterium]|nr:phosphonate metabolism protein/1,5-bisphosphokinase (PRPP-forming) PhnN [Rhodobiaceae bacterium]
MGDRDKPKLGPGGLVLVVGPSGAGKDTLIAAARARLDPAAFVFPRRQITRPRDPDHEDHEEITEEEFERRVALGQHCLAWHAHGFGYIVPETVEDDIRAGRVVVVNVSRGVVTEAQARFAHVFPVLVTASTPVLAKRLAGRGRETAAAIAARLERAPHDALPFEPFQTVVNDGGLDDAVTAFLTALRDAAAVVHAG